MECQGLGLAESQPTKKVNYFKCEVRRMKILSQYAIHCPPSLCDIFAIEEGPFFAISILAEMENEIGSVCTQKERLLDLLVYSRWRSCSITTICKPLLRLQMVVGEQLRHLLYTIRSSNHWNYSTWVKLQSHSLICCISKKLYCLI